MSSKDDPSSQDSTSHPVVVDLAVDVFRMVFDLAKGIVYFAKGIIEDGLGIVSNPLSRFL